MNVEKLLKLNPANLAEVRVALNEAIPELRQEAEKHMTTLLTDPKSPGVVKDTMLTITVFAKAARDLEKLEAGAKKVVEQVQKRLPK